MIDFGKLQLHTKTETAKKLRISVATLDRRIADNSISYYKIGWQVFFDNDQIAKFLFNCQRGLKTHPTQRNESVKTAA